ncbi:uncharacterized protein ALTATR162_LOCUS3788 [Alternaria atra]|uniref:Transcription elongation factor Eaf N-terminal domain-containing protein n=1 Tax=Alternaria atra TaxID=119953 RepID=A0A8J2I0D9_9PLEO|nr:uncharacterized protein ALTATR162_LOCUS3788 [Alternaria atra]CAG5155694.1 unnamed protein product [Alternaria atra]
MLESRIEPHKKAHFSLHISDRIGSSDDALGDFSSVKYNHKPSQTSESRSTTLTSPSSTNLYNLRIDDTSNSGDKDVFTFTGQKSQLKKSYVLVFDASNQQATLEPLSSTYTFNLATKNGKDVSSQHAKIYPKKLKDDAQNKDDEEDLFGEAAADDQGGDPDADNPYDFRHFLSKDKENRGDESEYRYASSPDYRTGTGSAVNTPQFGARATAATAPAPRVTTAPVPKKRKTATANPMVKPKKAQAAPAVRLQRPATDTTSKPKAKPTAPPASKIKSSEVIHSSDESDGEVASSPARPSPPPEQRQQHHDGEDDAEGESDDDSGLEIEVPDARPPRRNNGALASLGLGQSLGAGYLRSPSNGPISLASAANSDVEGSPNPHTRNRNAQEEIDFGDLGGDDAEGEDDDEDDYNNRDIEPMDIGPPARQETTGHDRKSSMAGEVATADDDDEDDLEALMMRGLEGGDSSEESEEE